MEIICTESGAFIVNNNSVGYILQRFRDIAGFLFRQQFFWMFPQDQFANVGL